MEYYRPIYNLPFVDYTLSDLAVWREILLVEKMNNFVSTSFERLVQIVYYQFAIEHYDVAAFFIKKCFEYTDHDLSQIVFLKFLDWCRGRITNRYDHFGSPNYNLHDYGFKMIFDLALKKYVPALLFVCDLCIDLPCDYVTIGNVPVTKFLKKLYQIEKILIEENIDEYLVHLYQKNIKIFTRRLYPLVYLKNTSSEMAIILKLAICGSEKALIKSINLVSIWGNDPINLLCHNVKKFSKGLFSRSTLLNIMGNFSLKFFRNKEVQFNCNTITALLKSLNFCYWYSNCGLIKEWLEYLNEYFIEGGNNVGIILAYSDFCANPSFSFSFLADFGKKWASHNETCKGILLKYYKNGLMYPITENSRQRFSPIHQTWPISRYDESTIKSCVPIMVDLMINYYWFGYEYYYEYSVAKNSNRHSIADRLNHFNILQKMTPIWWKVSLCVLGINILEDHSYVTQETLLNQIFKLNNHKPPEIILDFSIELVFINVLDNLQILAQNYKSIFQDDNLLEVDVWLKIYEDDLFKILEKSNVVHILHAALEYTLDLMKFSQRYVKLIHLHELYKPHGELYLETETNFNKRVQHID